VPHHPKVNHGIYASGLHLNIKGFSAG